MAAALLNDELSGELKSGKASRETMHGRRHDKYIILCAFTLTATQAATLGSEVKHAPHAIPLRREVAVVYL